MNNQIYEKGSTQLKFARAEKILVHGHLFYVRAEGSTYSTKKLLRSNMSSNEQNMPISFVLCFYWLFSQKRLQSFQHTLRESMLGVEISRLSLLRRTLPISSNSLRGFLRCSTTMLTWFPRFLSIIFWKNILGDF